MNRKELRKEVNTHPTEGQCKAGNYKMAHLTVNGFEISIENPKGSYRRGKDKDGHEWKTLMRNDYGYFRKTVGKDGDAIDVFLGPNLKSNKIFPIDQFINGEFDETKVMMGFNTKEEAKNAYLSNYEKDWKGFKYITEVDLDTFAKWLYDGYRQRKPFAKYASLKENKINVGKLIEEMEESKNKKKKAFNSADVAFKSAHRDEDGQYHPIKRTQVFKDKKNDYDRKKGKAELRKMALESHIDNLVDLVMEQIKRKML